MRIGGTDRVEHKAPPVLIWQRRVATLTTFMFSGAEMLRAISNARWCLTSSCRFPRHDPSHSLMAGAKGSRSRHPPSRGSPRAAQLRSLIRINALHGRTRGGPQIASWPRGPPQSL